MIPVIAVGRSGSSAAEPACQTGKYLSDKCTEPEFFTSGGTDLAGGRVKVWGDCQAQAYAVE